MWRNFGKSIRGREPKEEKTATYHWTDQLRECRLAADGDAKKSNKPMPENPCLGRARGLCGLTTFAGPSAAKPVGLRLNSVYDFTAQSGGCPMSWPRRHRRTQAPKLQL